MLLPALVQAAAESGGLTAALQGRPLLALGLLFGAGVATSLTPCIYPMIPITIGVIGGTAAGRSRARTVVLTLTYALGLAMFYALLGVVAGLSGSLFGTVSASPWARFAIGNLLLLFGLAMLDVIPVAAPQRLLAWAGRQQGGTVPGVFLLGATSGIVAAPCGAPAFAAVLTWVAGTGSGVLGFFYLLVFSLGMTALLVVVGLFSGTLGALPRSGRWMVWIKKLGGFLMIGVAEYYFVQMGMVW
ncbi:MAG: sulfite exporter TauE/SafE family protein [Gemmatimonadota bacterium]|nr:sulfite exporter TauE/SafE family protein [Gemmatimonadota bacterium]